MLFAFESGPKPSSYRHVYNLIAPVPGSQEKKSGYGKSSPLKLFDPRGTIPPMGSLAEIRIFHTDPELDRIIRSMDTHGDEDRFGKCFNYNEEFFLKLENSVRVPHFPIHHDVRKAAPEEGYASSLRDVFAAIAKIVPSVFRGLTYVFNPSNTFMPAFYALYRVEDRQYLYLLRIDLMFKPQYCKIEEKGTNDITPSFETNCLFVDANFIPLDRVDTVSGRVSGFTIRETISETWIGEQGRGYFQQGIWMDNALTSFFSRLFLPAGIRVYPFYPFLCKYKTVCSHVISFLPEERERELPFLHNALLFLEPEMRNIEAALRTRDFSPELDVFVTLKRKVPAIFEDYHAGMTVHPYLNENNMKEYSIGKKNR